MLTPDRSLLLTAEDARLAACVQQETLRDWVRRGLLTRYGSHRFPLYDLDELAAAAAAAKPRRQRDTPRRHARSLTSLTTGTTVPLVQSEVSVHNQGAPSSQPSPA